MKKRIGKLARTLIGAMLLAAPYAAAQAQGNKWVTISNQSSSAVLSVYYSNPSDGWGPDRLGADTIPAGNRRRFNVSDHANTCVMDLKAVMTNGEEHVRMGVDVCSAYRWRLRDGRNDLAFID